MNKIVFRADEPLDIIEEININLVDLKQKKGNH
jgi:hypothetical protein